MYVLTLLFDGLGVCVQPSNCCATVMWSSDKYVWRHLPHIINQSWPEFDNICCRSWTSSFKEFSLLAQFSSYCSPLSGISIFTFLETWLHCLTAEGTREKNSKFL